MTRWRAQAVPLADLVVVAGFRDTLYPGLVSTGRVERGGDKPFHTVINAENYLALKALTYTHRGRIDAIYIDPPYNTGAKDWKYNNDYVEAEDLYRHSKWLAMMERRLLLARELLNPANSVLIVTIDEKEYLRLGLLLEQTFPEAWIQMVSVSDQSCQRGAVWGIRQELTSIFFSSCWAMAPRACCSWSRNGIGTAGTNFTGTIRWDLLRRSGQARTRDGQRLFYPVLLSRKTEMLLPARRAPIGVDDDVKSTVPPTGTVAVWPIRKDGSDGRLAT